MLRPMGIFVPMSEMHIGKVLRELYLASGLKMARFASIMHHSPKTIYYHFSQEHLNTAILDTYEEGLREMGNPVDLWELISRRRRGEHVEPKDVSVVSDPVPAYGKPRPTEQESVADLLRRAARLLDEQEDAPKH